MLVCHCKRVSDRTIRAAVESGATCRSSVGQVCGAGTGCGGCVPEVERIIQHTAGDRSGLRTLPLLAVG